jgi:hypothetical protein
VTTPTPTGAAPVSFTTLSGQPESYYQQLFTAHWGSAAGTAYAAWNAKNPAGDAYANAQSYMVMVATQGLAKAIASVGTFVGSSVPTAVADAASGSTLVKGTGAIENALTAIPDFISRLTSANLWERIGEVVLGLILVAVGVAHITHAVPLATKVAKTVGVAALA